jgi:glycosyltransferase involved in cell wall biosynthesis
MAKKSDKVSRKDVVILHISAPGDQLGAGITDYCDRLVTAQKKQGIEAYYVLSNGIANQDKLNAERHIGVAWTQDQATNQTKLETIEREFQEQGKTVIWHFNLAPPACGPIVSPEWLKNRKVVGTIHECKIPDGMPKDTPEEIAEHEKAVRKSDQLIAYAKHLDRYMISQEAEAIYLQGKGVTGDFKVQEIPPNIDPRLLGHEPKAPANRKDVVAHFGMIRAKKGVDSVIEAQQQMQGSGVTTHLAGKVTEIYFDMFVDVLNSIYGKDNLQAALGKDYETMSRLAVNPSKIPHSSPDYPILQKYVAMAGDIVKKLDAANTPKKLNINFYPNATEQEIIDLLNNAKVAYLPFDRGADFHSGSLPTCILMDTAIVTTHGDHTPPDYEKALVFAQDPAQASKHIISLVQDQTKLEQQVGKQQSLKELYPEWQSVASKSKSLYNRWVEDRPQRAGIPMGLKIVGGVIAVAVAVLGVSKLFRQNKNLKGLEKEVLQQTTGITKYNFIEELQKANDKWPNIIEDLQGRSDQTSQAFNKQLDQALTLPNARNEGQITLISEDDHMAEHQSRVDKLIDQMKSRSPEENAREIIFIERKEAGTNLGMRDVKLLAAIINHNENDNNLEKIVLPNGINESSAIYQDAKLYNAAIQHGVRVVGVEGK